MLGNSRVLEILLEIENLTVDERAQVQDGLKSIRSDTSPNNAPESETFSDLAALINVHYRNQSEEEASAVRVAQAQTGSHQDNQHQVEYEPHRPPAASQDSERRQLAKKINDIIKANTGNMETSGAGKSTGLNRRARWNMEKLAAGSIILPVGGAVTATAPTGNTANSQAVARKVAQGVHFFFFCNQGCILNYFFLPPGCETACKRICAS